MTSEIGLFSRGSNEKSSPSLGNDFRQSFENERDKASLCTKKGKRSKEKLFVSLTSVPICRFEENVQFARFRCLGRPYAIMRRGYWYIE